MMNIIYVYAKSNVNKQKYRKYIYFLYIFLAECKYYREYNKSVIRTLLASRVNIVIKQFCTRHFNGCNYFSKSFLFSINQFCNFFLI